MMSAGSSTDQKAAPRTGDRIGRQAAQTGLLREMDRLAKRVAEVAEELRRLQAERGALEDQVREVTAEYRRLLNAGGVEDAAQMMEKMGRLSELEKANRAFEKERREAAQRLDALIEKVDSLQEES